MPFVADDLGAWLVGLLADAGLKKLTTFVLGSDQERALRSAATAAVRLTAAELRPDGEQAEELAMVVSQVFSEPVPEVSPSGQSTLLEALQTGVAGQLAVLDDASLTGTGRSSAEVLGVPATALAEKLAGHLAREIMIRGSRGGPLAPLADQLNHDVTHLQGQRLEGMLAQLVSQVTALALAGGGRETPRTPVRLPPRPVLLAGREDLLAEVGARLTAGDDPGPRLVALCGLAGAGKTSVAVEYAHRHLAEVGVAWQFAADDPTVLAAGFGELAAQLGARDLADARDPVASVHAVLAAFPAPWLLIFDNAADMASVAVFLPPAGPGQVLITSQNPNWPGQALEVPVLAPDVAADFLVNRTGDPDRQAAQNVADMLDGLPLALEQAAAYMTVTGDTLASYLALFRRRQAEMLARGEPTGYDKTVVSTWALAFDRLQAAPGAVGLLRLLAFCAPEAIPLRLLLQPRPGLAGRLNGEVVPVLAPLLEDRLAADDAIGTLRRHSLVTLAVGGSVSVHRLVQAVTADQMPAELAAEWQQAAAALIEAAIPRDTGSPRTWQICAALLPHARAALTDDSVGMARIANYLGSSGNYAAARDLQQRVLDARTRVLGPEHPGTLAAWHELAHWTGRAGDAAAARDLLAELLPVRERVLGPEDRGTLATLSNLADWTGEAGDAAAARDLLAALLPLEERILGPEHPGILAGLARPGPLDRAGGGCGRRPGPVGRAAAGARAGHGPGAPGHPSHPRQPRPLDWGGGGCGRRPGPVGRAAAGARAGHGPGAPGHPSHPRQPRPLDWGGGGCGRRPGPVGRAAALGRAGPGPGTPGHPGRPARPRLLDWAGGGCGRRPGPVGRAAAGARAGHGPGAPGHSDRPRQPRLLDRAGRRDGPTWGRTPWP